MIIFDLDQTLIDTLNINNYDEFNNLEYISKLFTNEKDLLVNLKLRPYIKDLFDYLNMNNYEYSFWSLADYNYVKIVINYIKNVFFINPRFILARKNDYYFIDLISNIEISIIYTKGIMIKKIESLYENFLYLNENKIILIDDNIDTILNNNPNNVYHISKWFSYNIHDIELYNFKQILFFLRLYSNY
jgi:hypothetical protein